MFLRKNSFPSSKKEKSASLQPIRWTPTLINTIAPGSQGGRIESFVGKASSGG